MVVGAERPRGVVSRGSAARNNCVGVGVDIGVDWSHVVKAVDRNWLC